MSRLQLGIEWGKSTDPRVQDCLSEVLTAPPVHLMNNHHNRLHHSAIQCRLRSASSAFRCSKVPGAAGPESEAPSAAHALISRS